MNRNANSSGAPALSRTLSQYKLQHKKRYNVGATTTGGANGEHFGGGGAPGGRIGASTTTRLRSHSFGLPSTTGIAGQQTRGQAGTAGNRGGINLVTRTSGGGQLLDPFDQQPNSSTAAFSTTYSGAFPSSGLRLRSNSFASGAKKTDSSSHQLLPPINASKNYNGSSTSTTTSTTNQGINNSANYNYTSLHDAQNNYGGMKSKFRTTFSTMEDALEARSIERLPADGLASETAAAEQLEEGFVPPHAATHDHGNKDPTGAASSTAAATATSKTNRSRSSSLKKKRGNSDLVDPLLNADGIFKAFSPVKKRKNVTKLPYQRVHNRFAKLQQTAADQGTAGGGGSNSTLHPAGSGGPPGTSFHLPVGTTTSSGTSTNNYRVSTVYLNPVDHEQPPLAYQRGGERMTGVLLPGGPPPLENPHQPGHQYNQSQHPGCISSATRVLEEVVERESDAAGGLTTDQEFFTDDHATFLQEEAEAVLAEAKSSSQNPSTSSPSKISSSRRIIHHVPASKLQHVGGTSNINAGTTTSKKTVWSNELLASSMSSIEDGEPQAQQCQEKKIIADERVAGMQTQRQQQVQNNNSPARKMSSNYTNHNASSHLGFATSSVIDDEDIFYATPCDEEAQMQQQMLSTEGQSQSLEPHDNLRAGRSASNERYDLEQEVESRTIQQQQSGDQIPNSFTRNEDASDGAGVNASWDQQDVLDKFAKSRESVEQDVQNTLEKLQHLQEKNDLHEEVVVDKSKLIRENVNTLFKDKPYHRRAPLLSSTRQSRERARAGSTSGAGIACNGGGAGQQLELLANHSGEGPPGAPPGAGRAVSSGHTVGVLYPAEQCTGGRGEPLQNHSTGAIAEQEQQMNHLSPPRRGSKNLRGMLNNYHQHQNPQLFLSEEDFSFGGGASVNQSSSVLLTQSQQSMHLNRENTILTEASSYEQVPLSSASEELEAFWMSPTSGGTTARNRQLSSSSHTNSQSQFHTSSNLFPTDQHARLQMNQQRNYNLNSAAQVGTMSTTATTSDAIGSGTSYNYRRKNSSGAGAAISSSSAINDLQAIGRGYHDSSLMDDSCQHHQQSMEENSFMPEDSQQHSMTFTCTGQEIFGDDQKSKFYSTQFDTSAHDNFNHSVNEDADEDLEQKRDLQKSLCSLVSTSRRKVQLAATTSSTGGQVAAELQAHVCGIPHVDIIPSLIPLMMRDRRFEAASHISYAYRAGTTALSAYLPKEENENENETTSTTARAEPHLGSEEKQDGININNHDELPMMQVKGKSCAVGQKLLELLEKKDGFDFVILLVTLKRVKSLYPEKLDNSNASLSASNFIPTFLIPQVVQQAKELLEEIVGKEEIIFKSSRAGGGASFGGLSSGAQSSSSLSHQGGCTATKGGNNGGGSAADTAVAGGGSTVQSTANRSGSASTASNAGTAGGPSPAGPPSSGPGGMTKSGSAILSNRSSSKPSQHQGTAMSGSAHQSTTFTAQKDLHQRHSTSISLSDSVQLPELPKPVKRQKYSKNHFKYHLQLEMQQGVVNSSSSSSSSTANGNPHSDEGTSTFPGYFDPDAFLEKLFEAPDMDQMAINEQILQNFQKQDLESLRELKHPHVLVEKVIVLVGLLKNCQVLNEKLFNQVMRNGGGSGGSAGEVEGTGYTVGGAGGGAGSNPNPHRSSSSYQASGNSALDILASSRILNPQNTMAHNNYTQNRNVTTDQNVGESNNSSSSSQYNNSSGDSRISTQNSGVAWATLKDLVLTKTLRMELVFLHANLITDKNYENAVRLAQQLHVAEVRRIQPAAAMLLEYAQTLLFEDLENGGGGAGYTGMPGSCGGAAGGVMSGIGGGNRNNIGKMQHALLDIDTGIQTVTVEETFALKELRRRKLMAAGGGGASRGGGHQGTTPVGG
ncbi:unnamed protein product [Amoebophrya sp. A120]|nr:unnamed protein product [Amoebophrya sp. A120]|eukprot:GSA120T00020442001.1